MMQANLRCCGTRRGTDRFGAMRGDLNRWFDEFFPFRPQGETSASSGSWFAPLSLWEDNERFYIEVELPGVLADDVNVTVEKGTLRVEAQRKPPEHEDRKNWHEERRYGSVVRSIVLPETVDEESIEADLHDGVLHLKLAKRPETKPKRVEIKLR